MELYMLIKKKEQITADVHNNVDYHLRQTWKKKILQMRSHNVAHAILRLRDPPAESWDHRSHYTWLTKQFMSCLAMQSTYGVWVVVCKCVPTHAYADGRIYGV